MGVGNSNVGRQKVDDRMEEIRRHFLSGICIGILSYKIICWHELKSTDSLGLITLLVLQWIQVMLKSGDGTVCCFAYCFCTYLTCLWHFKEVMTFEILLAPFICSLKSRAF